MCNVRRAGLDRSRHGRGILAVRVEVMREIEPAGDPPAAEDQSSREQLIDDELEQSFPASDPPGWVFGDRLP